MVAITGTVSLKLLESLSWTLYRNSGPAMRREASAVLHDSFVSLKPIPPGWLLGYEVQLPAQGAFLYMNTWRHSFKTFLNRHCLQSPLLMNLVFMTLFSGQKLSNKNHPNPKYPGAVLVPPPLMYIRWSPGIKTVVKSHCTILSHPSQDGC